MHDEKNRVSQRDQRIVQQENTIQQLESCAILTPLRGTEDEKDVTIKVLGECISNLKEGHKAALLEGERRANEFHVKMEEQNERLKSCSYQS